MDKAQLVRQIREVRQHVRNHLAVLTARLEIPERTRKISVFALEGDQLVVAGKRLAVTLDEFGFVIPGVDMAQRARSEDYQNVFGFGSEVRRAGTLALPKKGQQRDTTQAGAAEAQEIAPIQQPSTGIRKHARRHRQTRWR